jgi:hypothetical protein
MACVDSAIGLLVGAKLLLSSDMYEIFAVGWIL